MAQVLLTGSAPGVPAVASALEERAATVTRAADAVDALDHLEVSSVDAVATTADPGPVTGTQFVRRLRRSGYTGPVVLLLGADDDLTRALGGDADAVAPLDDPARAADAVREQVADDTLDARQSARRQARAAVDAATAAIEAAGDRGTAERALCAELAGAYRSVWVGRHDEAEGLVRPVAAAGVHLDHLGAVPVDGEGATAEAVRSGEPVPDGAGVVVPVTQGGRVTGVLHVFADRPVRAGEADILAELGAALGRAFVRLGAGPEEPADRFTVLGDSLAHELANHVDVATMHLELAREREENDSHYEYVESSLDRMAALADDARALARDDLRPQRVALDDVAEAAWDAEGVETASLVVPDGELDADPDQLRLLLENLFRNAVEHGSTGNRTKSDDAVEHGGPEVTVEVGTLDGGFYVADDGPGIPEAERERVLEWGVSGGGGTGVGLGIVSLAAERHGWSVEVGESEAGGARFEFR